jgi:hypothetical protein
MPSAPDESNETDDDYEVGYGKPPKHARFKKGQSGNPSGRKKKRESAIRAQLIELLTENIPIKEGGKRRNSPGIVVVVKQLLVQALKGDKKTALQLYKLATDLGVLDLLPEGKEDFDMSILTREEDETLIEAYHLMNKVRGKAD